MKRIRPRSVAAVVLGTGIDSLAIARKYIAWFFTGQMDSLWSHQSADGVSSSASASIRGVRHRRSIRDERALTTQWVALGGAPLIDA
jgi:hypothetical protein